MNNEEARKLGMAFACGYLYAQSEGFVEDGGVGSGNHGHKGIIGHRGGSLPTKRQYMAKATRQLNKRQALGQDKNYRQLIRDVAKKVGNKDGTYSMDGKEVNHSFGYQLSFQTTSGEDKNSPDYLSNSEYDRIANEIARKYHAVPEVGVFEGTPEISFMVRTKKEAMELIKKYNQNCAFNWRASVWYPDDDSMWFLINEHQDRSKNKTRR